MFSSPTWGLKIRYPGPNKMGPKNIHGGNTSYFRFEIHGEEAVNVSVLEIMCRDFMLVGSVIEEARERDIENEFPWGNIMESVPCGEMK